MFSFVIEKTGDVKASPVFLTNDSNFDKRYIPMIFAPLENGCEPFYKGMQLAFIRKININRKIHRKFDEFVFFHSLTYFSNVIS